MLNSILAWVGIIGLIAGAYFVGVVLEQKLQPAKRELGPRPLRRY